VHSWPYSISGQEGRSVSLYLRVADPALGGRFRTTELSWSWTEYVTAPWARLHVLAMQLNGGIGIGDRRGLFGIGGFVEQDLVRAIFLNQRVYGLFLRGYPAYAFIGDSYQVFSAEYRAPLVWIERGYQTFPLYFRRIWGALFLDAGNAYNGRSQPQDLKVGAGAEVHFQFNIAYYLNTDLKLGFAHGFSQPPGGDQVYFVAAASF
jgi:surface antigen Omp85-like protein